MEAQTKQAIMAPPRLIPSFMAGFNSVAGHIHLIIMPVLLDLILWFAPRLNIKTLLNPLLSRYMDLISTTGSSEVQTMLSGSQPLWEEVLLRFNMLSTLRTLPIGVPSLLSGRGVMINPLGSPAEISLTSLGMAVGLWLLFAIIGIGAGSIFFDEIARISLNLNEKFSIGRALRMFRNTLYLTFSSYALLFILSIPAMIVILIISLISPSFSQISVIFISLILIWLLMPLIFSPHGIYSFGQNIFTSAINSIRLVRYFLPGTGIFILLGVLLSQGMDILWTFPAADSWMVIVGILGHAFITTSLVASSFIYYRGGVQWMNEKMQHITNKPSISLDKP